jgi:TolB-like protein/class 3 adenylate cyclase
MSQSAELKTVLVSDLVNSTHLVEELGDARAAELFHRHEIDARALLQPNRGREIDKTDGFLLLFDRPINAVSYALAYHDGLARLSREFGRPVVARVGIHLGEVTLRENQPEEVGRGAKPLEVDGIAKVIAARLMTLAAPRQTLLTRAAFDLARRSAVHEESLPRTLVWRSHADYRLKGVSEAVEVCEVGVPGVAPLVPPAGSEKAQRVGGSRPGILVLPFPEPESDGDSGHLGDALAEEIITSLSRLDALRVIASSASAQLKGTTKDPRTLGRELGVQYVLQGSLRRAGNKLRIMVQLTRTDRNEVLWGDGYTGKLDDLFEIQEIINRTVADALRLQLTAEEERKLAARPIPNVAAYEYYLRAKQETYRYTCEALDRAQDYLQKGIAILGDNIQLEAALGLVYWQYFNAGIRPDPAYLHKARECAHRIFAIDPDSPDGHRLLGLVEIHAKGDPQEAVRHLKLAVAADPNDTDALAWLSAIYGMAGRSSSAHPLVERLLEIDPITPALRVLPGYLAMVDGDLDRARGLLKQAAALNDANPGVVHAYGQCLAMCGRAEEAHRVFDHLTQTAPDSFFARVGQCYQHALRHQPDQVAARVTPDVREAAASDGQYAWSLAQCFALAGDVEQGLDWLSHAVQHGNWNYPLLADRDPLLVSLRGEQRFRDLMREVRQKWLSFEV